MRLLVLGIAMLFIAAAASAQTIGGNIYLNNFKSGATFQELTPVQLFKQFKDNKISLGFTLKSNSEIVLFDMKTTVKHKGAVINSSTRPGWPWLPGDLFVPAEAFDFIPMLQKLMARGTPTVTFLPAGEYEIIMQMVPSAGQDVKGSIMPATLKFTVQ